MKQIKVKLTFLEELLGTMPNNEEVYEQYIASNAPDAPTRAEEVEAFGADEVVEKGTTVFPRDEQGRPYLYDYQIKGFFKDACGMMRRVKDSKSAKLTAYKKIIDGLVFVAERRIPLSENADGLGLCQRPLRAQTAQGERVALACSETIPAGTTIEFTVCLLDDSVEQPVREWLDYGAMRGIGQWRNSGKGRFAWEEAA